MAGDDANPAVPGYDPDISAELYTTNGDTDAHATVAVRHARLHAGDVHLPDGVRPSTPTTSGCAEDCVSGFNFPDDEELIQAEFAKNMPFALSVAKSAHDPDDPVSVGRPDGRRPGRRPVRRSRTARTQQVAVDRQAGAEEPAAALLGQRRPTQSTDQVAEWQGGERYGDTDDDYYAEFRGTVTRHRAG